MKIIFFIGVPIGSLIGGTLFNRFGSVTSFRFFSYIALAVCIVQTITNRLINRFSKIDVIDKLVTN